MFRINDRRISDIEIDRENFIYNDPDIKIEAGENVVKSLNLKI